jgi:DNA-binding CsgD family transcriptional regulator
MDLNQHRPGPTSRTERWLSNGLRLAAKSGGCRVLLLKAPLGGGRTSALGLAAERALALGFDVRQVPPSQLVTAVVELLEADEPGTVALLVDDAHALELDAAEVLARRVSSTPEGRSPLVLVLALQTGPGDEVARVLGCLPECGDHELPTLDAAAMDAMVAAAGAPAAGSAVDLLERTAGNPWLAEAVLAFPGSRVPRPVEERVYRICDELDEDSLAALVAVALAGGSGLRLSWIRHMFGDSMVQAVARASRMRSTGLFTDDDAWLALRAPLLADAVFQYAPLALRRASLRMALDAMDAARDGDMATLRTRSRMLRALGDDAAAAAVLREAALEARRHHDWEAAATALNDAANVEPDTARRLRDAIACAHLRTSLDHDGARECWKQVARLADAVQDDEASCCATFQLYWASGDGAARDRLARAATLAAAGVGWGHRAAACRAMLACDYHLAVEHDRAAVDIARQQGDVALEALAAEKLAVALSYVGDLPAAIDSMNACVEGYTQAALFRAAVMARLSLSDMHLTDLHASQSLEEARRARQLATETGFPDLCAVAASFEASTLLVLGRLEDAAVASEFSVSHRELLPPGPGRVVLDFKHAQVLVETADAVTALAAADAAVASARDFGYESFTFEACLARVRALVRATQSEEAIEVARSMTVDEPSSIAALAAWAIRTGLAQSLPALVALGLEHVEALPPRAECDAVSNRVRDEADAARAADTREGCDALLLAAREWETAERPLDAARVELGVAASLAARGETDRARGLLRSASAALRTMGARADLDVAASLGRALGVAARNYSPGRVESALSPRERDVAQLLVGGAGTAEIAASLRIAPTAVYKVVSSIYRKSGTNTRTGLMHWMTHGDGEAIGEATAGAHRSQT